MPRRPADLTGKRYGMLTVTGLSEKRNPQGRILYRCRCDCGRECLATRSNLERMEITSCGCKNHLPRKNLTGQKFGRLTVLEIAAPPNGRSQTTFLWRCQCNCGNIIVTSTNNLTRGKARSCGCLQRETIRNLYQDNTAPCKLHEAEHPRASNTSGVTGVWWDDKRKKWVAEIMFQRKKIFLGRFDQKEDAVSARKNAEIKFFKKYLDQIKPKPSTPQKPSTEK